MNDWSGLLCEVCVNVMSEEENARVVVHFPSASSSRVAIDISPKSYGWQALHLHSSFEHIKSKVIENTIQSVVGQQRSPAIPWHTNKNRYLPRSRAAKGVPGTFGSPSILRWSQRTILAFKLMQWICVCVFHCNNVCYKYTYMPLISMAMRSSW